MFFSTDKVEENLWNYFNIGPWTYNSSESNPFRKKIFVSWQLVPVSLRNFFYWVSHTLHMFVSNDSHGIIKWYKSWVRIYNTLERLCCWSFTLTMPRVPRIMWYLTLGKSLTLTPLTKTIKCSCELWPIPGI